MSEIDRLGAVAERLGATKRAGGCHPSATDTLRMLADGERSTWERSLAVWLYFGQGQVFLQDADAMALPVAELEAILLRLSERLPSVSRIASYARTRTVLTRARKDGQLDRLRSAGLARVHVGIESGSNAVLRRVNKGCSAEEHAAGCLAAQAAGFELCTYVMPGLGGRALSEEHVRDTVALLRRIGPHEIRFRSLWIDPDSQLEEERRSGAFQPLDDQQIVGEIRDVLRGLGGMATLVSSDYVGNLLGEVVGNLSTDGPRLEGVCSQFLALPRETQDAFIVARRTGRTASLGRFLDDPGAFDDLAQLLDQARVSGEGSVSAGLRMILRTLVQKMPGLSSAGGEAV